MRWKKMTNEYYNVKTHVTLDTENEKVKLLVQSMSHDKDGEPDFVDIRKFRGYNGKPLMYTAKGIHFSNEQLEEVINGLLDAHMRINGVNRTTEFISDLFIDINEYNDV